MSDEAGRKEHWEKVYAERKPDDVSWFQAEPARSLEFIQRAAVRQDAALIDVGGGASVLGDWANQVHEAAEDHRTPWDKEQKFRHFLLKRKGRDQA